MIYIGLILIAIVIIAIKNSQSRDQDRRLNHVAKHGEIIDYIPDELYALNMKIPYKTPTDIKIAFIPDHNAMGKNTGILVYMRYDNDKIFVRLTVRDFSNDTEYQRSAQVSVSKNAVNEIINVLLEQAMTELMNNR